MIPHKSYRPQALTINMLAYGNRMKNRMNIGFRRKWQL
jgi:hypothetical protein